MSFNTQPPEGGWHFARLQGGGHRRFNTQPPEGGWPKSTKGSTDMSNVSTHSRPKAAGTCYSEQGTKIKVSTHSRPKAAGVTVLVMVRVCGCFNTQPPEGGWRQMPHPCRIAHSFNTQPPEGGWTVWSIRR